MMKKQMKSLGPTFALLGGLALTGCATVDRITPGGARIQGFTTPILSVTDVSMDPKTVESNQINAVIANPDPTARCIGLEARENAIRSGNTITRDRVELEQARDRSNGRPAPAPTGTPCP